MRTVLVETMPEDLRESHEAAGNSGCYPHNGAVRCMMPVAAARAAVKADPDWTEIIRSARRGDRWDYGVARDSLDGVI